VGTLRRWWHTLLLGLSAWLAHRAGVTTGVKTERKRATRDQATRRRKARREVARVDRQAKQRQRKAKEQSSEETVAELRDLFRRPGRM
jgi:hypothetical protein